jgi:hypothetical protein
MSGNEKERAGIPLCVRERKIVRDRIPLRVRKQEE